MNMAGVFRDQGRTHTSQVADFDFTPDDKIAQMIVDAWVDKSVKASLLNGDLTARKAAAKAAFAKYGFYWNGTTKHPVIISEQEYANDWQLNSDDELCFVLPNHDGTCPLGQNLLETARLLMAATPHGI
jgi:hypothetical protein